jgi:hypothetical protein
LHKEDSTRAKLWNISEGGSRIVVEVATAYAITKVLLPLRLILSVWGTPWFARIVVGRFGTVMGRMGSRLFGKRRKVNGNGSPAAGTGSTGKNNSAVGKDAPSGRKL